MVSGENKDSLCKVCGTQTREAFQAKMLGKYAVSYFSCPTCEYICTEPPHWLDEAYRRTINIVDTGIMDRNMHFSKVVSVLLYYFFNGNGTYLDYAGGYGIFTRIMRDIGFNFYWYDPYCENLIAPGFEYKKENAGPIDALTAFEVFEHFVDPLKEIDKMRQLSKNIIFSTELMPTAVPQPGEWWYYGLEHGQHVSFYSTKTLRFLAKRFGSNFYSAGGIHIFSERKLPSSIVPLMLRLSKYGLFGITKAIMQSKTWEDHLNVQTFKRTDS